MRINKIDNPDLPAEGLCNGLPYTTATYNADGCAIHFWFSYLPERDQLMHVLRKAMNARDIVKATWSFGVPADFWAHQDID